MKSHQEKPAAFKESYPSPLLDFMRQKWAPAPRVRAVPHPHLPAMRRRRETLGALFPESALVIPSGNKRLRSNDTEYPFRPGSDFSYLTGGIEPDAVLVMVPQAGGVHSTHLFVYPRQGRDTDAFFTDKYRGELWVGPTLGIEGSRGRYGVDEALPRSLLADFLTPHRGRVKAVVGLDSEVDALAVDADGSRALAQALHEMRLIKDEVEVREIRRAVNATKDAYSALLAGLAPGVGERELEARFEGQAAAHGYTPGYETIVASGAHACVLHWTANDGRTRRGDLVLVDAGVEVESLYTADITRTFPVTGRFSPVQRDVYQVVWAAKEAAIRACRAGNEFLASHRAATKALVEGLCALGVFSETPEEVLATDRQLYRRYTLHGTSHMVGLDVHDCMTAREELYRRGTMREGMVFTIEPGLYFQPDDLSVAKHFRGIGIRLEDDVLVTARAPRNLSNNIPSECAEVEAWMRACRRHR